MTMMSTTKTTTKKKMWRSKLGNEYDMDTIERNDGKTKAELDRLRLLPANKICADCGKGPTNWASVNLGVFLCMKCGSYHRGIGTHISKPKGFCTYLWGPDEVLQMSTIGNAKAKQIYGGPASATDHDHHNGPDQNAPDSVWQKFLIDKYQNRRFVPRLGEVSPQPKTKRTQQATLPRGAGRKDPQDFFDFFADNSTGTTTMATTTTTPTTTAETEPATARGSNHGSSSSSSSSTSSSVEPDLIQFEDFWDIQVSTTSLQPRAAENTHPIKPTQQRLLKQQPTNTTNSEDFFAQFGV